MSTPGSPVATLHDTAMSYHERGWAVIPVLYKQKKSRVTWRQYQKTAPERGQIDEWFRKNQGNIGILLGPVSHGLTCLDFDSVDAYNSWAGKQPDLARTLPTVRTGRGRHVYFTSDLTKTSKGNGADLKASGYVLAPPSVHPNGQTYEWIVAPNVSIPCVDVEHMALHELGFGSRACVDMPSGLPVYEPAESQFMEDTEDTEDTERDGSNVNERTSGGTDLTSQIEKAVQATLPGREGERNRRIFEFCRYLKGIPDLKDLPARQLKEYVRRWHQLALPFITTKCFDDTWADFVYGWSKVKWPKDDARLARAIEMAVSGDCNIPVAEEYESERVKLLVKICYALQQVHGNEQFFLSCSTAGDILGISHTQANEYLKMLVEDDVLEVCKEHTAYEAARYRFKRIK